jgi:hypothetical protein
VLPEHGIAQATLVSPRSSCHSPEESAAALTAAKIDLLPHQVVLPTGLQPPVLALPRADEVGLGKTIETALLLRELASRGELDRALM